MPNPNDGTQLGTGEVISDEYIDPNAGARGDPNLPPTGFKVARSKIAVGQYGQDQGDASVIQPLPVADYMVRREAEQQELRDIGVRQQSMCRYAFERTDLADRRGNHLSMRGVR